MRAKILAIPIVAVLMIGAVAGLSLSGAFSHAPNTTKNPVYVGYLTGVGQGGINATTAWGEVKNTGNGTATILFHSLRDDSQANTPIVANITDGIQLSPGQSVTLSIQGTFQSGHNYQFAFIGGSDCGPACGGTWRLNF